MRMKTSFINTIICIWLLSDKNGKSAFFLSQCVLEDICLHILKKMTMLLLLKLEVKFCFVFF